MLVIWSHSESTPHSLVTAHWYTLSHWVHSLGALSIQVPSALIHWKDWCWSSNTLATWYAEPTHWKRPWCWERLNGKEGAVEDEMLGWHHHLKRHEFEQTLGDSEGQGSLACCSPWGHKESDMTEWLNNSCPPLDTWLKLNSIGSSVQILSLEQRDAVTNSFHPLKKKKKKQTNDKEELVSIHPSTGLMSCWVAQSSWVLKPLQFQPFLDPS